MKLACQENMVPGDSFADRVAKAQDWGYEGVEIWGSNLRDRMAEIKQAFKGRKIKVSTICSGFRGCLLDPEPAERNLAMNDIKELLALGGQLGAVGLIMVPIFGRPRLPDASPLFDAREFERRMFMAQLEELAEPAEKAKCAVLVEPLNRYETHWINRLEQAVEMVRRVKSDYVKTTANLSACIFGNWNDVLIGSWGPGIDILVDPYTGGSTGAVRVRVFQSVDIAVRQPASFAVCTDIITA